MPVRLHVLATARVAAGCAFWDVMVGAMAGKKPGVGTAVAKPETETEPAVATDGAAGGGVVAKSGLDKRKLIMMVVPLLVAGLGAGLWFSGVLPRLLGLTHEANPA